MGLSDKKQTQTSNNATTTSWGHIAPPNTPDLDNLRNRKFQVDPGISAQYSGLRSRLAKSFNSPTGAYYNPQVQEGILRSRNESLGQQEGQAFREGQFDVNKLNYGRDVAVAGMTAPQLVQTGGTSSGTGTIKSSQSPWGTIAQVGAQVAPMLSSM